MKKTIACWIGVVVLASMIGSLAVSTAWAAKKKVTVTGTVSVYRDDDGKIESAELVTDDDNWYFIVLDTRGLELGAKLDGKYAKVVGFTEEKDEDIWLTVASFEQIEDKEEGETAEPEEE